MTRQQRESIFKHLTSSVEFGEGWVTPIEIDKWGLAKAMRLGVIRSLKNLGASYAESIIMDGRINYLPRKFRNVRCQVNADALVPVVSAASIYAKVCRDRFMIELAKKHVSYGFENHVGYYTPQHRLALQRFGPLTAIHRLSFKPLRTAR